MNKTFRISVGVLLSLVLALLSIAGFLTSYNPSESASLSNLRVYEDGWSSTSESGSASFPMQDESAVCISNTLPPVETDDNLILWYQKNIDRIEIDGETVFTYEHNRIFNRPTTLGTALVFVPLDSSQTGKTVSIYYNDGAYTGHAYVGSKIQYLAYQVRTQPARLAIAIIFGILGIIMALFAVAVLAMQKRLGKALNLALASEISFFFVCVAVWIITDSEILVPLLDINVYNAFLSYLAFMILPIPLVTLFSLLQPAWQRVCNGFAIAFAVNLVVQMTVYVAGGYDLPQMLKVTHLLIVLTAIGISLVVVHHLVKRRSKDELFVAVVGVCVLCLLGIGGILSYYHIIPLHYMFFVNLGIVVFALGLTYFGISRIIKNIQEQAHAAELEYLAYHDHLTGLGNRQSFDANLDRWRADEYEPDFTIVTMDVNLLKETNDTLGHNAGDEIIVATADCAKQAFGEKYTLSRNGGDEFAAVGTVTREEVETAIARFDELVSQWKGKIAPSLSVSRGYVRWEDHPQGSIEDLCSESDRMMYENKRAFYQNRGHDRRGTR